MAHPFLKIFDTALRNSTPTNNLVLKEAEKLKEKGYNADEIHAVLSKLQRGLIDDEESEIVQEAVDEFGRHLDQ